MGVFALFVVSIAVTLLWYAVADLIGEINRGDGGVEERSDAGS